MLGLYSVVAIQRHWPRCSLESLFLPWLLIQFIEENDDSQMYMEGNIVSRSISIDVHVHECSWIELEEPRWSRSQSPSRPRVAFWAGQIWPSPIPPSYPWRAPAFWPLEVLKPSIIYQKITKENFKANFVFFNIVYIFPVCCGCILIKTARNKYGLSLRPS